MAEKETCTFFTGDEFLEMDGVLLETNNEIMEKAGEICRILVKRDNVTQSLREKCSRAMEALKERDADLQDMADALKRESHEKQEWADKYDLLEDVNRDLEEEKRELNEKLDAAGREKESLQAQLRQLSDQEENYQTLKTGFEQIRQECRQHYTDVRNDRDEARAELEQCRDDLAKEHQKAEYLQGVLDKERVKREEKESEVKKLKEELTEKDRKIHTLNEKNQRYLTQREKMPALMGLYDAYDAIMQKRDQLPREYFECLQKAMPMDNFDGFLSASLKRSFPIACHLALQSFVTVSSSRGQVSDEAVKETLRLSDRLLEEVFAFGSQYFKEEKLSRIKVEKGDLFEDDRCTYINGKGGMYGNIADIWLHGLRDEKENKIYHSYVEGE